MAKGSTREVLQTQAQGDGVLARLAGINDRDAAAADLRRDGSSSVRGHSSFTAAWCGRWMAISA
jgi:hypothetical protein